MGAVGGSWNNLLSISRGTKAAQVNPGAKGAMGISHGKWLLWQDAVRREHRLDEFHGEADDVRLAAAIEMEPARAVLKAESARLTLPKAAGEVVFQVSVGDLVHVEFRRGEPHVGLAGVAATEGPPDADAAVDAVVAAAESPQHVAGVGFIAGLTENLAAALGERVAGEDHGAAINEAAGRFELCGHVERFAHREFDDQRRRAAGRADAALGGFGRRQNLELVAGATKQFAALRRAAGEYQLGRLHG